MKLTANLSHHFAKLIIKQPFSVFFLLAFDSFSEIKVASAVCVYLCARTEVRSLARHSLALLAWRINRVRPCPPNDNECRRTERKVEDEEKKKKKTDRVQI